MLLLCLGVVCVGGSAASAATRGVLSSAEFQQLQLAQKHTKSLESADARNLMKASAVCTHLRHVSRLITAVRKGCLDLVRLGGDRGKLNARATKCGIDPGSEAALLSCMVPAVRSYYSDAEAFYRAETSVNHLAKARGFSNTCVAVIGDSQGNLAAEGRLAQDLKAAVNALQKQDQDALQTLFGQIDSTVKSIKPGPSSLSLCPHD